MDEELRVLCYSEGATECRECYTEGSMKRTLGLLIVTIASLLAVASWQAMASAQQQPLSDAHIEVIKAHCVDVTASLNQLHASDALLRVNRGQVYESISTKLMIPLNSRLVLNRLDSGALVAKTAEYDRQLTSFRLAYQQYEKAMSRALTINCKQRPSDFYWAVNEARAKRQSTHESVKELQATITQYGDEFTSFSKTFEESNR